MYLSLPLEVGLLSLRHLAQSPAILIQLLLVGRIAQRLLFLSIAEWLTRRPGEACKILPSPIESSY